MCNLFHSNRFTIGPRKSLTKPMKIRSPMNMIVLCIERCLNSWRMLLLIFQIRNRYAFLAKMHYNRYFINVDSNLFPSKNSETWSGYRVKVKVQLMLRILDRLIIHRDAAFQPIISHTKTLKDINHQLLPYNLQNQNVSAFLSASISIFSIFI